MPSELETDVSLRRHRWRWTLLPMRLGDGGAVTPIWMVMFGGAVRGVVTAENEGFMLRLAFDTRLRPEQGKPFESLEFAAQEFADILQFPSSGERPMTSRRAVRDIRQSAAYRRLVAVTGLDPALTRVAEIKTPDMHVDIPGLCLRVGQSVEVPKFGIAKYVSEHRDGEPLMELPSQVRLSGYWDSPLHDFDLGEAPRSAAEYWDRVHTLESAINRLGGRLQLWPGVENGWLPVMERLIVAIIGAMELADRVRVETKSKYGTLRVCASFVSDVTNRARCQYVADVGDWAEAATTQRCQAFGIPGWAGPLIPDSGGWIYTLCDDARALPPTEIRSLIYPRPAPENGDA